MPMSVHVTVVAVVLLLSITQPSHAQFGFSSAFGGYDPFTSAGYGNPSYGRGEWLMDDPFKAGQCGR